MSGASDEATRATAVTVRAAGTRRRRASRSPSGTRSASPRAYPTWEKVTTSPTVAELAP